MKERLKRIEEGLKEIFPETEDMEMTADTCLGEVPDWDSMAAVNLQAYLEQTFRVSVLAEQLDEDTTLGEVVVLIEEAEKINEPA